MLKESKPVVKVEGVWNHCCDLIRKEMAGKRDTPSRIHRKTKKDLLCRETVINYNYFLPERFEQAT